MDTVKYSKGKVIFYAGDVENCMYDIVSGSVAIVDNYGRENEKTLVELEAGHLFGELGMAGNIARTATAVATKATEVKVITNDNFQEYFKENPDNVMLILCNTSHRIRALTKQYLDVCKSTAEYVKCQENGEQPDRELVEKLKKIAGYGKKKK